MRRSLSGFLLLLLAAVPISASGMKILLVARDHSGHPLPGFCFSYQGIKSLPTNQDGTTDLQLHSNHLPGAQITISLVPNDKRLDEWFLVNPHVNIPSVAASAEVVLLRRRSVTAVTHDKSHQAVHGLAEVKAKKWRKSFVDAAARHGLGAEETKKALRSFAKARNPEDKGLAAYLGGEFSQAEEIWREEAKRKKMDFLETLYFLGTSQYEQGKYSAAADTFREAVALRGQDSTLSSWLDRTLQELAGRIEVDSLRSGVLRIDDSFSPNQNYLASLLQSTTEPSEAEARRALANVERSLGSDHPDVAVALNQLAALLQTAEKQDEAVSLMRRALAIDEKFFGPDHRIVAADLGRLAQLLQATDHQSEVEDMLRRALAIDERSYGSEDPKVANRLSDLALFLKKKGRFPEAEPLMIRALAIGDKRLLPSDPNIAIFLNNLAQLLKATNRRAEAEPLLRRALTIDESEFGLEHPNVAVRLNNLAQLLRVANRHVEAEPHMRRALLILLGFQRRNGYEHPNEKAVSGNFRALLKEMGKADAEISTAIEELARSVH